MFVFGFHRGLSSMTCHMPCILYCTILNISQNRHPLTGHIQILFGLVYAFDFEMPLNRSWVNIWCLILLQICILQSFVLELNCFLNWGYSKENQTSRIWSRARQKSHIHTSRRTLVWDLWHKVFFSFLYILWLLLFSYFPYATQ